MTKTMEVKIDLTQVRDGLEYKGNVSFDEHKFQYQVRFGRPIKELDELKSPEEIIGQIHIDVKDAKGKPVSLDEDARELFLATAANMAIEFYHNPQTRDSNGGFFGMLVRGEGPIAETLGGSAQIGMSAQYKINRIPPLEKFLKDYKKVDEQK